jgi:hypothetical protein
LLSLGLPSPLAPKQSNGWFPYGYSEVFIPKSLFYKYSTKTQRLSLVGHFTTLSVFSPDRLKVRRDTRKWVEKKIDTDTRGKRIDNGEELEGAVIRCPIQVETSMDNIHPSGIT